MSVDRIPGAREGQGSVPAGRVARRQNEQQPRRGAGSAAPTPAAASDCFSTRAAVRSHWSAITKFVTAVTYSLLYRYAEPSELINRINIF